MPQPPWAPEREIGLDEIRRRIAAEQPDLAGLPIEPLGQGWDSVAVRIGAGTDEDWVFRFTRRALAARLMVREIAWVPALAPALPLPIAVPLRSGPPTPDEPLPYTGHRWLAGATGCRAPLDDDGRARLAPAIGALLGALHALPVPDEAPSDEIGRGDHVRRGNRAIERLDAVGGVDMAAVRAAIEPRLAAPAHDSPPRWVHGDLYGRHLLIDDRGGLAAVIDWGDVHAGDPAIDLSIGWSFLPPSAREALIAAYVAAGGPPPDGAALDRARVIALDYAGALIPYGRDAGDDAVERLGWLALRYGLA